ncbi:MAG: aminopeptidase [Halieaceae bacterium]|jgi:predicted aminopeptidase|nr:aminopeptidase [Halieaceae bacterium]
MPGLPPILLVLCLCLAGCDSLGYYSQAAAGQLSLLSGRQPIAEILEQPDTLPELKTQLALVQQLREFAKRELLLPVGGQYSHYVALDRDFVVWNVFAAEPLSFQPRTWCYPIAGCVGYRGYFSEEKARNTAAMMDAQGLDTYVGGVAAYSTLGWLDDPVLSSFIYREEARLADLIFHELAHRMLYIPGDTLFNESFATAVASEGVRRWMLQRGEADYFTRYKRRGQQRRDFIGLLGQYREKLAVVYNSAASEADKYRRKGQLIDRMREDYQAMQQRSGGTLPYTNWITAPINNAKLNSVAFYHDLVPGLEAILAQESFQLTDFYARCVLMEQLTVEERHRQLGGVK